MPDMDQAITGAFYFELKLGAHEASNFKECDGLGSESEVVEHRSTDARGMPMIQKVPGLASWPNITLKRGIDATMSLWAWREMVMKAGAKEARTDITITIFTSEGAPMTTFNVVAAWPRKYSAAGLSAAGNEVLIEEIELVHEGLTRV
jgi:phage tail-like protein